MPPKSYNGPRGPALRDAMLEALHEIGGIGSVNEIFRKVVEIEGISEEILAFKREYKKQDEPQVKLLMKGQFDYMKKRWSLLENPRRNYWKLTERGKKEAIKPRGQREHNASRTWRKPGKWSDLQMGLLSEEQAGGASRELWMKQEIASKQLTARGKEFVKDYAQIDGVLDNLEILHSNGRTVGWGNGENGKPYLLVWDKEDGQSMLVSFYRLPGNKRKLEREIARIKRQKK